jgi:hypothetical protein
MVRLSVPFDDGFPYKLSDDLPKFDFACFVDGELFDTGLPPKAYGRPERKPNLVEVVGFRLAFDLPDDGVMAYRRIIEAGIVPGLLNG